MSAQALTVVEPAPRRIDRIQVTDPIPVMDTGRFEQMQRIASIMARSTLLPETIVGYRNKDGEFVQFPYETIVSNCFLVVNQAVGWSMDPFSVIQCVSVVHGRICYEGKLVAAVIERRAGVVLNYAWNDAPGDALEITVSGTLPGETTPRTVKGTVAKWRTNGKNSPWGTDARKQLAYRGAREWERLHKPGTMLGVYTDDELEDAIERQARRPPPPPSLVVETAASEPRKSAAPAIEHKLAVEVAPIADTKREPVASTATAETNSPAARRKPPVPPSASASPAQSSPLSGYPLHKSRLIKMLAEQRDVANVERVFDDMATNRMRDFTQAQYEELKSAYEARLREFDPGTAVVWSE